MTSLPKHAAFAKQTFMLTGLGRAEFDLAARAILEIQTKLSSALLSNTMQNWKPNLDQGKICIEFSN